ncbi:MAG: ATP-binding protein [Planctomycetota bacterium]
MGEIRNNEEYHFPSPGQRFYGATWSTISKSIQGQMLKIITRGKMGALVGPAGTGKTWACWATIFGVVAKKPRFGVRLIDWSDLCVLAAECEVFGERGAVALEQFDRLAVCRLLVIDEFGMSKPRENQFHRIYGLINRRYSQCRATLITTTMSLGELEENMGEATVSRFRGGGIIEFNGRDRRIEVEV